LLGGMGETIPDDCGSLSSIENPNNLAMIYLMMPFIGLFITL